MIPKFFTCDMNTKSENNRGKVTTQRDNKGILNPVLKQ